MLQKTINLLIFFFISNNIQAQNSEIDSEKASALQAMWSITSAECLDHVKKLASDEFAGRATGSKGFEAAAHYIADQLKKSEIKPAIGDTSFFQMFDVTRNEIGVQNEFSLEIQIESPKGCDTLWVEYLIEKDFLPIGSSATCNFVNQVVFAGYGMTSPENNWDDYANLNVKDKIVLVLSGAPPIEGANFGRLHRVRNKIKFAENAGATGFIIIGDPIGVISDNQKIPSVMISEKVANDLLKGTGHNIIELKQAIKQNQQSIALDLTHRVKIKVKSQLLTGCRTMNIIGYLEGHDPSLKNEYIVIGAHADHIGTMGELIFYGANDNASGTATIMEIAEAFSKLDKSPRRSLVFIAFSGEEMGLLGSKYYTDNPIFPLKNTKAMINLDMVGSGREAFMVVGGNSYPDFTTLFDNYSARYIHAPIKRRWISPNSDHYPFHEKGIPSVFLYAMHGPPTYHSTRDKPETLDAEVMESVGRLAFWVLWDLANTDNIDFPLIDKTE